MKKLFITICIGFSLFFCSCDILRVLSNIIPDNPYIPPKFSTKYTVEEHIQRLKERTEDVFEGEIWNGEVVGYKVDIVYSLAFDLPEFFVVEIEYAVENNYILNDFWLGVGNRYPEEYRYYQTKYKHLMGYIEDDEYYSDYVHEVLFNPRNLKDELLPGRTPYSYKNYWDKKKYYGEMCFAVEVDGEKRLLFDPENCRNYRDIEYHVHWSEETGLIDCTAERIISDDFKPYRFSGYPYNGLVYTWGMQ